MRIAPYFFAEHSNMRTEKGRMMRQRPGSTRTAASRPGSAAPGGPTGSDWRIGWAWLIDKSANTYCSSCTEHG